jgi:hypothetical protein
MVSTLTLSLEEHVRLTYGIRLGIDLLTVEQAPSLPILLCGNRREGRLCNGEHASGPASAVVEQVGAGPNFLLHWQKHEIRHQSNGIARCPVLSRLFVVFLVEFPYQFLKDRPH